MRQNIISLPEVFIENSILKNVEDFRPATLLNRDSGAVVFL